MNNRLLRLSFYLFFSIVVGVIVGIIDFIFSKGLNSVSQLRGEYFPYTLFFLPFAGILIIYLYEKYGKNSFKGMSLVFHSLATKEALIPKRLIPFVIVSTWLTHFFGGSAGREGVAVQIGATVANNFSTYLENKFSIKVSEIKPILASCGVAAGFSGLFGTPLAATIFSMEILKIGILEYRSLLPSLVSAYTALFISNYLGLEHFSFILKDIPKANMKNIFIIIFCSLIFSFIGYFFSFLLKKIKINSYLLKLNPMKRIFIGSIFLALMLYFIHNGRYSGLGTNLIEYSFHDNTIYSYDWLLKILFTVLTLGIGFQGGEVTPLFSIGASLGFILGNLFNLSPKFMAAIGYCTVFSSATNTFLASVFIGLEIFGYDMTLYLFISCAIAFVFSGDLGIYSDQKKNHHKF